MSLPGGTSDLRPTRPKLVPILAMRCLSKGGPSDLSAKRTSAQFELISGLGLTSQRSFLWKTNKQETVNVVSRLLSVSSNPQKFIKTMFIYAYIPDYCPSVAISVIKTVKYFLIFPS